MKKLIIFSIVAVNMLVGCGVTSTSVYPGTGLTYDLSGDNVDMLGEITTCQGAFCTNDETGRMEWAMSLQTPPPASTYQAALRKKAARVFKILENKIVVGEVTVGYHAELDGTIRGWNATAIVGGKRTKNNIGNGDAGVNCTHLGDENLNYRMVNGVLMCLDCYDKREKQ